VGTTPFIMVLISCAQPGGQCEPVTTMPVAYASQSSCQAAKSEILSSIGGDGMIAECRRQSVPSRKIDARVPQPTA
jgi:hypothetical protein